MEKHSKTARMTAAVTGLIAAVGFAKPVMAQLEEIVVTAQKREQSLQDVGISATAFTADTIEQMSFKNVGDALDFAPNIQRSFGPSASSDGFFFFRGVGQSDVLVVVDPGVAVYIDDVYLGRLQGASFDVLDIERIELLRGPQGTLFGRNTIGGAVSVHTRDPGDEFGANGRVTVGERDRYEIYGAVDIPLADTLGASISAYSKQQEGWITNVDGTTLGDTDTIGTRAKLVWDATDSLTLRFIGDYSDSDGTPTPQMLTAVNPNRFLGPLGIPLPMDLGADVVEDPFNSDANISVEPTLTNEKGGLQLVADWDVGPVTLKSITAWRMMEQEAFTELDGGPYNVYDTLFTYDQDQVSQEFQLSGLSFDDRLTWLLGAYYFHEDVTGFTNICVGNTAPPTFNPVVGNWQAPTDPQVRNDGRCYALASEVDLTVDALAGFGQLEYALTDTLTAILGLRYTYEKKQQDYNTATDDRDFVWALPMVFPDVVAEEPFAMPGNFVYDVSPNNPNLTIPYQYEKSWNDWSPKIGLNYQASDATLLYISWSKGFKSGGFGGRNQPGEPFQPYDPEIIKSWELGFKTEFWDRRARVNAAAFLSDYEDVQLLVIADVQGGDALFITANGGEARIKGLEFELQAAPTDGLNLNLGLGYLSTRWVSVRADAGDVDPEGSLPQTPKWTANVGAGYTWFLGSGADLTIRGDYSYRSDFFFDAKNEAKQEAFDLLNLRATYNLARMPVSLSIYGLNVADEEYFYTIGDQLEGLGVETSVPAPGREWGVEVNFDFR